MIDDAWLRAHGFKWHEVERSGKHWLLWIGSAIPDPHRNTGADDFGIELGTPHETEGWRNLWLRADYAGRYSRFLFCRRVTDGDEVLRIIEAIIHPRDLAACLTPYGYATTPEAAARMAKDAERFDRRVAESQSAGWKDDRERATKR